MVNKITVKGLDIMLYNSNNHEFISLTSIARYKDSEYKDTIIQNWIPNRNTIELLGF